MSEKAIRHQQKCRGHWPLSAEFLHSKTVSPPSTLVDFLLTVITGKSESQSTAKTTRLASSVAEDICSASTQGEVTAVPCPQVVKEYTAAMGGCDLNDQMTKLYRSHRYYRWPWRLYDEVLAVVLFQYLHTRRPHQTSNTIMLQIMNIL